MTDINQSKIAKRPSLKINAISNWGPLAVNFIVGFLLTPYLIAHLGKIKYGTWALVGSLIGYYGLLRLGVGAGVMRYVPFYKGSKDTNAASQIVTTAMAIFLVVGLAILLISMLLAEPIARFYKAGPELATLILILGGAVAIECPMRILDACIRAHEHWIAANCITVFTSVIRALGLAGCIYFGHGIIGMGYVILSVNVFSIILVVTFFRRLCPSIQIRPSMIKTAKVRILLSFGILSTVITLAYTLTLQGQSLIIGKIISLEAVAIYAVPVLLMRNARGVLLAPARVFWPRFANLDGKNHQEEIICLFIRGIRLFAIFASGVTLMIFVFGQSFIRLWINETFEAAYPVLLLMAGGFLVEGSQTIMGILLSGTGRQGTRAFFAAFEGLIGFGLSIILTIQFGLVGAALGFVVAVLLIRGLICPWYICRLLRINVLQYFRENILRPWLILFFLTFIFYSIGFNEFISNWLHLIVMAIIIGGTYIGLIYCFAINQGEREAALNFIRRFISLITLNRCRKKAEIPGNVGITSSKDIDV